MDIQKKCKDGFSEYSCFHGENKEGTLYVGFSNYFEVDPVSGWGLIPIIYHIEGTDGAQEGLLQYLFRYAKSPILAKVTQPECHQLEKFGFSPSNESNYVWDPTKKEDVESE